MAVETELKLRIAPERLAKLKRHPLLKAHQLARPMTRRLYNIYYDTPKFELHQSGMALRLRRSGRQWLQTLKGGGSVHGGLHQRNEWEMPVSGPALDFSLPQATAWKDVLPKHLRKQLRPVFVTDFSRNSRMLLWQDAQIELCMDQGEVSTEKSRAPVCELELELISGKPQQLFGLALALLDIVPFELESISKAEQGFHLLSKTAEQPLKALPLNLVKQDDLGKAMQMLIWSVLQHVQSNVHGATVSGNSEYLHQLRVALRRLRVLLRMVESICADEQLAIFRKEVAALCITLGRIREWDVFLAQTVQPLCERMPQDAGLQALVVTSEQHRDVCCSELRNDMQVRELQRLLLRLAFWMHGPYWQQVEISGLSTCDVAATYLTELARQFAQAGEHLDTFDAAKLHAMRIRTKKLRYCAEFFASLYGKHKSQQYLTALSAVQEVLGQINDDAVANRLLDDLAKVPALTGHQDAIALGRGWVARELSQQFGILQNAVWHFQRQPRYWEK
jgi:inorganic triphosphatase YgiF